MGYGIGEKTVGHTIAILRGTTIIINTMGKGYRETYVYFGTTWKGFMEDGTPKQGFADGAGAKCALFKEKMYTKTQRDGQDIPSNTLPCKVA